MGAESGHPLLRPCILAKKYAPKSNDLRKKELDLSDLSLTKNSESFDEN